MATVKVKGHTRANGTKVKGHTRVIGGKKKAGAKLKGPSLKGKTSKAAKPKQTLAQLKKWQSKERWVLADTIDKRAYKAAFKKTGKHHYDPRKDPAVKKKHAAAKKKLAAIHAKQIANHKAGKAPGKTGLKKLSV